MVTYVCTRVRLLAGLPLAVIIMLSAAAAIAQETPAIKVTQLSDHIYRLTTDRGTYTTTVLVSVGDDGVLLVDTDEGDAAEELKKVVEGFGHGGPKYIINTHRHVEHVGGNAIFGKTPTVIAHDLVRTKLRSGSYLFEEFPDETLPDITLTDSLSLYFNGEKIRIIALPGGHDDNEIIVHFTESKVVHLSSLVNGLNFPSVDSDGDVLKIAGLVVRAIDLLPEDVVIVSGHNQNCTWHDLSTYRDMLLKTTGIVREGLAAGKDLATLQEEKVLADWESYAGSYVSPDQWIKYLVEGLEGKEDRRKRVFEPLYYAYKDAGAEAALEKYRELKQDHSDDYIFEDYDLMIIGSKLLAGGEAPAAAKFLEFSLQEYPTGKYAWYTNFQLAGAYDELGNRELAIQYCEKALELSPDNEDIEKLLERLRGE
jgi:glyoxylase-like metal-dependent hydrolase (beta-lactamase superfamily II)